MGATTPLTPPLYLSSVYTFADLDALDRVYDGSDAGYIYARDAHPNAQHLAQLLAAMEGGTWAQITGSGMAAIANIVLSLVGQGQRIVANSRIYGRTLQLFEQELGRFGVETVFVDLGDLDAVRAALAKPTRVLYAETISNPLLCVVDLPALAELAHAHDCQLVVDNTFATPVLARPLELGADVVMESLTKMIGGHSDLTLGMVAGKGNLLPQVSAIAAIWGLCAGPFDCWLAERGLATLPLRMGAATANAAALADWLAVQPRVAGVLYPGRQDHADHEVAARLLPRGFGNMLCFELEGGREAVNRFIRQASGIAFSPSLGDHRTTLSHPWTTSHRYTDPALKTRQGITEGLVRMSVGIEDLAQLKETIEQGLKAI